jgi:hypothetical protein
MRPSRFRWPVCWICGALLVYLLFRMRRADLSPGIFRDAFPSLLCPFVLMPALCLLRMIRGRAPIVSLGHDSLCLLSALLVLEGLAPLAGKGTFDVADAAAFTFGACIYRVRQNFRNNVSLVPRAVAERWREVPFRERSPISPRGDASAVDGGNPRSTPLRGCGSMHG